MGTKVRRVRTAAVTALIRDILHGRVEATILGGHLRPTKAHPVVDTIHRPMVATDLEEPISLFARNIRRAALVTNMIITM